MNSTVADTSEAFANVSTCSQSAGKKISKEKSAGKKISKEMKNIPPQQAMTMFTTASVKSSSLAPTHVAISVHRDAKAVPVVTPTPTNNWKIMKYVVEPGPLAKCDKAKIVL